MRVVVTGGAGFLPSHVCDALIDRGDEVVCLDNLVTGSEANIAHLLEHDRFDFRRQDVSDPFDVDGQVDAIMHLASPASPKDFARLPLEILDVGSLGTRNCLSLAVKKGSRFFLASTSEVYGDPTLHPQPETYWGNVNPIGKRGCYDEAKRFAEATTMAYVRTHDVDARIVRIFNTYGPRMRPDDGRVTSNFITQALRGDPITVYGDGGQTRSFCFVSDQVRGHLALLDSDVSGPVNIGNDSEITIGAFAEVVIAATGSSSTILHQELPEDDPTQRQPVLDRARNELGWQAEVSLEDGLAQTAAYFRSILSL